MAEIISASHDVVFKALFVRNPDILKAFLSDVLDLPLTDKINQLRHVRYFKSVDGLKAHMEKQANYLRPKFDCALAALRSGLSGLGIGTWTNPNGGYFISYDGLPGTAKRCVQLCADAGVKLTPAGSCYPYGIDPEDQNIRIAPSYPSTPELYQSIHVFCICQRIAALEVLLAE